MFSVGRPCTLLGRAQISLRKAGFILCTFAALLVLWKLTGKSTPPGQSRQHDAYTLEQGFGREDTRVLRPPSQHKKDSSRCDLLLRRRVTATQEQVDNFRKLSRTQDAEDIFLVKKLPAVASRIGGVVLESGAVDGMRYSSTFAFERALNWTAVHVEAAPDAFERLEKNRPASTRVKNIHAALCSRSKDVHFMMPKLPVIRGIWEFMSPAFRARWYPRFESAVSPPTLKPPSSSQLVKGGTPAPVKVVRCQPLNEVLPSELRVVDVWFLDVEGAEADVLRATDFSRLQVGIVVKERAEDVMQELESTLLLRKAGFAHAGTDTSKRNSIFVNECLVSNLQQLGAKPEAV